MSLPLVVGVDIGTSGARALATNGGEVVAQSVSSIAQSGGDQRNPDVWWTAVCKSLAGCLSRVDRTFVRAIAVGGTSGTVLPVDSFGKPIAEPLMYNEGVPNQDVVRRIAPMIPAESAAHGPTSGLAKMLCFQSLPGISRLLHQADWISGRLSGRFDVTDENNALKSGYDPVAGSWPEWLGKTGLRIELLPQVVPPGSLIGPVSREAASLFDLPNNVAIIAGTTDGCASFLATGASEPGDAVSALGSTLTLKLLSDAPVFAPQYGIYSHRVLGMWLAGGASNTGGKVLARYFNSDRLKQLSSGIDPERPTNLDYYPLLATGERFPVMDPQLAPRLEPRPKDDVAFLQGMLEGIAAIEHRGYLRLSELGAPRVKSIRSVGGGASNPQWTRIRQIKMNVPMLPSISGEAAYGTARLALAGAQQAGLI